MGTVQGPEASRQNLSAKEFELIRQLIQSRAGQGREMAYEELEGYSACSSPLASAIIIHVRWPPDRNTTTWINGQHGRQP